MSENQILFKFLRRPGAQQLIKVIGLLVLLIALFQSLIVTVSWWRQDFVIYHWTDRFWILSLPVLMTLYFRHFSIFRHDCPLCPPADGQSQRGPHAP